MLSTSIIHDFVELQKKVNTIAMNVADNATRQVRDDPSAVGVEDGVLVQRTVALVHEMLENLTLNAPCQITSGRPLPALKFRQLQEYVQDLHAIVSACQPMTATQTFAHGLVCHVANIGPK